MKIAAVQDAPVFLDRQASVEHVVNLIHQAARAGADIVGFPEGFLPGHPGWIELHALDQLSLELSKKLFTNAVEVDSPAIEQIRAACRDTETAVVLGICERNPGSTGTLFNTQLHIDEHGTLVGKHQKYVPTVGERLVHAPGTTGSYNHFFAHEISVSGLICGENSNPLAQYAAARGYPTVHVAAWPQHLSPGVPIQPVIDLVSKGLAYSLKCFVINAVTTISDRMVESYGQGFEGFLESESAHGRASIVSPAGTVVAEAEGYSPQIVYADIDKDDVIIPKFIQDTAGHYNRPELFSHLFSSGS